MSSQAKQRTMRLLILVAAGATLATLAVTFVLVRMFEHKVDARNPFVRVAQLDETSTDPEPWGLNWPNHYDQYKLTAGDEFRGGSSALAQSHLDAKPWLKRLYAGYAFAIDYREARGHAYMLYDQVVTKRVNERNQAGACLHCHGSMNVLYRKVGREAQGLPTDDKSLAENFDMPSMIKGFEVLSRKPYHEVLAMLTQVPDGTPPKAGAKPRPDEAPVGGFDAKKVPEGHFDMGEAHPVSCIDCHDPKDMKLRISRPGFMRGMADLAAGDAPVPHLPSVERWRRTKRDKPYDPNELASRQEMRSMVCGQCHVEYYCGDGDTLRFPWEQGLTVDNIEASWEAHRFPDGSEFFDYRHGETGAPLFKAQHPEFEMWSQGVHAQAGVGCADCHMPYERTGAMKLSNHTVQTPLKNISRACQSCHNVSEGELIGRITRIQKNTEELVDRAAGAMNDMVDAIMEAKAAGATEEDLQEIFVLQRKAMFRLDMINSENSRGFHAPQAVAKVLGDSIDYSRQAQAAALRYRAPEAPDTSELPRQGIEGVTPDR